MGDGDTVSTTVLLDSVASQANRAELALLEGRERDELVFPVPYVDFTDDGDITDYEKLTVLEAPHRLADAIFRDSLLDGTLFRLSDVGRAITDATPRNATDLTGTGTLLRSHLDGVGERAEKTARRLGLPVAVQEDLSLAEASTTSAKSTSDSNCS